VIKAKVTTDDGKNLLVFGISAENVKHLQQGYPIQINLTEMGLAGEMMIFYGETTGDLIKSINPYVGGETIVKDRIDDDPDWPKDAKYQKRQLVYLGKKPFFIAGVSRARQPDGELMYQLQSDLNNRGTLLRGLYDESRLSLSPKEDSE
jgi:hypothetical protein